VQVLSTLGDVALKAGDMKKAQRCSAPFCSRSSSVQPDQQGAGVLEARRGARKLGETAKAIQMVERAVQTDANLDEAKQKLATEGLLNARSRMRIWAGLVLGLLVRLWARTWRVSLVLEAGAEAAPRVLAFWHGAQMPLLALGAARPVLAMISRSRDGELSSGVMKSLGIGVVRGSSSRGGARALRAVVRGLSSGSDAAFAVDGPAAARRAKPGAALAAAIVSPGGPCRKRRLRASVLFGAWDEF
jgi:lysophospholipid acyltransferase (LPLAT)-like uncharacterized protein